MVSINGTFCLFVTRRETPAGSRTDGVYGAQARHQPAADLLVWLFNRNTVCQSISIFATEYIKSPFLLSRRIP